MIFHFLWYIRIVQDIQCTYQCIIYSAINYGSLKISSNHANIMITEIGKNIYIGRLIV